MAKRTKFLEQQEFEKVDIYATKFKRMLSRVNLDKGLAEGFIVEMFLTSLKKNNATFVAIAVPKDLNEAIAIARRVEADPNWNKRLREKKAPKVQNLKTNKTRQEIDLTQNIDPEKIQITDKPKRKYRPLVVDSLSLYNVAEDILSLPTGTMLSMNKKITTKVVMATRSKAKTLDKIRDVKIIIKDIIIPATFHIIESTEKMILVGTDWLQRMNTSEVLISNTGTGNINPYKDEEKYDSEGGNTFNEFDYEEDEEVDEVEGHFIEEYCKESLALFLTNIEEVPVEENKEETNMDEKL
ncbi:9880_t:CDS:2 [Gigaspora margarita]|uniref:9880_t:CDS:1 n=1 Tax=Gigaspora margarita TaxID=4874 RepID=A0ABN7WU69_GIGMA|nr:9880_t:CDS:2 [Gigaspora margarita]